MSLEMSFVYETERHNLNVSAPHHVLIPPVPPVPAQVASVEHLITFAECQDRNQSAIAGNGKALGLLSQSQQVL